jgi:predicted RND superfamily exporter protein
LTSLTTFVGLSPLLLNRSVQAQFLVPMACSLAFGVLLSTVVTLFVVPSAYVILEDLRVLASGRRTRALVQDASQSPPGSPSLAFPSHATQEGEIIAQADSRSAR